MSTQVITNRISKLSTADYFKETAQHADKIELAVAFFTDDESIMRLVDEDKEVMLIVSLRPPTDYHALKRLLHEKRIELRYLGDEFHSKVFAFYKKGIGIVSGLIGSSNFTFGGLEKNYETNVITNDNNILVQIDKSITEIKDRSHSLQPDILEEYRTRYDKYVEYKNRDKSTVMSDYKPKQTKILKVATQYLRYWNTVDGIREYLDGPIHEQYHEIPEYLVIDHFWHWVKVICSREKLKRLTSNPDTRQEKIIELFKEYCKWEKAAENNHVAQMAKDSNRIQNLLSRKNIDGLTLEESLFIYKTLHATETSIKRFGSDQKFIKDNSESKIRAAFSFLIHSTLPIENRLHELMSPKGEHKLRRFGESCVQELIGWANPETMPLRNKKADDALELLGF